MRKLLTLLFMLPALAFAQKMKEQKIVLPIDSISNMISYQEIVYVEGATKEDLYLRAKEWFARTFKSAKDVIQMDDRASGKIIGKGLSSSSYSYMLEVYPYDLHYTVIFVVKDGKYRYEITSMHMSSGIGLSVDLETSYKIYLEKKTGFAVHKKIIPFVDQNSRSLADSIKEALKQPAKGIKSKDEF